MKISVIMPVYNTEKYVAEALESILNQSFSNFEFIIIDDCSTDGSYEICKKYSKKDSRIKLFRNKENLGVVKTRNLLFKKINSNIKYIAIIDADDISIITRLEKQFNFLENNLNYSLVGSNIEIINEKGKQIGYRKYPENNKEVANIICKKSPIAQPSVMIRKKDLLQIGEYNEYFERSQDYELWFRFFDKGFNIGNIQEYLMKYRIFLGQGKSKHLKLTLKNTIRIQKRYIFQKKYFSVSILFYFYLEHLLLVFPKSLILFLFKKLEYKGKRY